MAALLAACLLLSLGLTAAADVRFLVLGDFGEHGSDQQRPVAESLGRVATYFGPLDFVLTVGDNIYDHGITNVQDPLWKRNLNDIYTAPSLEGVLARALNADRELVLTPCSLLTHLLLSVPWYGTMGSACPRGGLYSVSLRLGLCSYVACSLRLRRCRARCLCRRVPLAVPRARCAMRHAPRAPLLASDSPPHQTTTGERASSAT